jgi:hypothetical protein
MKRIASNGIGLGLAVGLLGLAAVAQNQPEPSSQNGAPVSSLGDYARQTRNNSGAKSKPKVFDNDNLPTGDKLSIVGSEEPTAPVADTSTETKSDETKPEVKDAAKAEDAKPEEAKAEAPAKPAGKTSHASPEGKPKPEAAGTGDEAKPEPKPEPKVEVKAAEAKPTSAPNSGDEEAAAKQAAWKQWNDKITTQKEQIDLAERELNVTQREYQIRAAAMYGDVGNRLRNSADWDKQDAQYKQQISDKQKALDDAKEKLDDMQEDARKAGVPESMREPQ